MKIISKFHDYYDINCSESNSQDIKYKRVTAEKLIDLETLEFLRSNGFNYFSQINCLENNSGYYSPLKRNFLGFCGKIYPFYSFSSSEYAVPDQCFFSANSLVRFLKSNKTASKCLTEAVMNRIFAVFNYMTKFYSCAEVDNLFAVIGEPLWVLSVGGSSFLQKSNGNFIMLDGKRSYTFPVIVNPLLKGYGFQKVVGPYQAHQEISMHLGMKVNNAEDNMPNMSDVQIRDQKGFDNNSFKSEAGIKKKRRKFNKLAKNKKEKCLTNNRGRLIMSLYIEE